MPSMYDASACAVLQQLRDVHRQWRRPSPNDEPRCVCLLGSIQSHEPLASVCHHEYVLPVLMLNEPEVMCSDSLQPRRMLSARR